MKWPVSGVQALDDDSDAWTENIGYDAAVYYLQRLTAVRDGKAHLLVGVVIDNRARLYDARHAHRLRGATCAAFKLRHGHVVDGVGLCVSNNEVDHCSQDGKTAQHKADWQTPFAPRLRLVLFHGCIKSSLHASSSLSNKVATPLVGVPSLYPFKRPQMNADRTPTRGVATDTLRVGAGLEQDVEQRAKHKYEYAQGQG